MSEVPQYLFLMSEVPLYLFRMSEYPCTRCLGGRGDVWRGVTARATRPLCVAQSSMATARACARLTMCAPCSLRCGTFCQNTFALKMFPPKPWHVYARVAV